LIDAFSLRLHVKPSLRYASRVSRTLGLRYVVSVTLTGNCLLRSTYAYCLSFDVKTKQLGC